MPECTWCHGGIIFRKGPDGKSHAYNLDDTPHRCKKPEQGTIARVTKYDVSNVYLNGNLFFLPPEGRKAAQEKYPVGTVVKAIIEKGICKGMENAAGADLEKFLKEEEAKRSQEAKAPAAAPQTPPPAEKPPAAPAAAPPQAEPKGTCTSPAGAAPVEPRKKSPIEENRMPNREELIGMVYSPDTYWRAKTLLDIEAHESICRQVETKNWQDCVGLAIEYHQRMEDGFSTEDDLKKYVFPTATLIHDFIKGKTGGAP
jgi:hypothetical protein